MDDGFLWRLLKRDKQRRFDRILDRAEDYRLQVLCSYVEPGSGPADAPRLVRHGLRVGAEYFYPASAVKLCACVGILRFLASRGSQTPTAAGLGVGPSFGLHSPVVFHPPPGREDGPARARALHQPQGTSASLAAPAVEVTTLAYEMRKLFLVSDNRAFNRLVDVLGLGNLNRHLWECGLPSARLTHRLHDAVPPPSHHEAAAAAVELWWGPRERAEAGVCLPRRHCPLPQGPPAPAPAAGTQIGAKHISWDGQVVEEPLDFSQKNTISLQDLQNVLVKVFSPEAAGAGPLLGLAAAQQQFLVEAMAQYPGASHEPRYPAEEYPDEYPKFFLPGLRRVRDQASLRVYNKLGRAYGFSVDNAYIVDIDTGRAFYLSAVIYTNSNGVMNDDQYEYDEADAFLEDLAEVVCRELWGEETISCGTQEGGAEMRVACASGGMVSEVMRVHGMDVTCSTPVLRDG